MIHLWKNLKTGVINGMKNVLVLKWKVRLTNAVCFGKFSSLHLYKQHPRDRVLTFTRWHMERTIFLSCSYHATQSKWQANVCIVLKLLKMIEFVDYPSQLRIWGWKEFLIWVVLFFLTWIPTYFVQNKQQHTKTLLLYS